MTLPFSYGVKNCFFGWPTEQKSGTNIVSSYSSDLFSPLIGSHGISVYGNIMLIISNWCENSIIITPSFCKSMVKRSSVYSYKDRPLCNVQSFSIHSYIMVLSCIVLLFLGSGPFHVTLSIIPVVIYPVYRMLFRWSWPNTIIKCKKIIFPFFTNSYASASIIAKSFVINIIASTLYVVPSVILRSFRQTMSYPSCFIQFFFKTTTAFVVSCFKRFGRYYNFVSTGTYTIPLHMACLVIFSSIYSGKPCECSVGKINKFSRHFKNLPAKVASFLDCGKRLLGYRLSGGLPYPLNIFTKFLNKSQDNMEAIYV